MKSSIFSEHTRLFPRETFIDAQSYQALGLQSLDDVMKPFSEPGRKYQKAFRPFIPGRENELRSEYAVLAKLMEVMKLHPAFTEGLKTYLDKIKDISNLVEALDNAALETDELFEIKEFSFFYEKTRQLLDKYELKSLLPLRALADLLHLLDPEGLGTPLFRLSNTYSTQLTSLREEELSLQRQFIAQKNNRMEIVAAKLGFQDKCLQIAVSRSNPEMIAKLRAADDLVIAAENFANITFSLRMTEDIINLEKKLKELRDSLEREELRVRGQLTSQMLPHYGNLRYAVESIARLDYLTAKALFGIDNDCIIPEIASDQETFFDYCGAVNLSVKRELSNKKILCQPVDIHLVNPVNVITGANMSGKSSLLNTIGQMVYLTAFAIPLPCLRAVVSLVDFIYSNRVSDPEGYPDLSSFAGEMVSLQNRIESAAGKGLFLIDELAKGTNPAEGKAIVAGLLDFFSGFHCDEEPSTLSKSRKLQPLVIASTHYSLPAGLAVARYCIKGIADEDYEKLKQEMNGDANLSGRIVELHKYMNYQPEKVSASEQSPREALRIAEILGVDGKIIRLAARYLFDS